MRKQGFQLICLILCLALSGCWDRKELTQLSLVSGIGVDYDDQRHKIRIIAEVIRPGQMQSSKGNSGGSSEAKSTFIAKGEGDTVFQALRRAAFTTTRKLNLTHNEAIILSDSIVRRGIRPVLDLFIRDPEPRPTQWILVSDDKPEVIFGIQPDLEKATAMMITGLMLNAGVTSEVYPVNLQHLITMMLSKTRGATIPMIKVIGEKEQKKLQISGLAVFKRDRMVGRLKPDETRGLLWVIHEVQSGIVVVDLSKNRQLDLEIIQASGAMKPRLINGQPEIDLRIKVLCNVGDQLTDGIRPVAGQLRRLEKKLAQTITEEIQETLSRARAMKTDIFGFGEKFHLKYPKAWKAMEPAWDQLFMKLKVKITVDADVRLVGEIRQPLTTFKSLEPNRI